ncbi:MAG: 6-hydroxycyclohex-1-ene-1-carbonyl-CoA dehydrogenase [Myxococcales bacterium]
MFAALAYVLVHPGKPLVRERRVFAGPGPSQAMIQVIGCGLCHTDLGYARGEVPTRKNPPLILGHEVVGRVVAVGDGVTNVRSGEAVLVPAVMPCGNCVFCASGRGNACPEQQMPGNDVDGGFATHMLARASTLIPLSGFPGGFELWKLAPVADAVSTAYQAVRRSGLQAGDVAAVVGAGGVGGFIVQVAAALGAHVFAFDLRKERLDLAARHGAEPVAQVTEGAQKALRAELRAFARKQGVPSLRLRIFECTGHKAGQALAFGLLDRGATMVQVGYTPEPVEVRLSNLMTFDAEIRGTWGCPLEAYPAVLGLIASGKVTLDPFVERAPMSHVDESLAAMHAGRLERRLVLDPES